MMLGATQTVTDPFAGIGFRANAALTAPGFASDHRA